MNKIASRRKTTALRLPPGWRVLDGEGRPDPTLAAVRATLMRDPIMLDLCRRAQNRPGRVAAIPLPSYERFVEMNREWLGH